MKDTKNWGGCKEKNLSLHTLTRDVELKYYRTFGFKDPHVRLLKRLLMFSKNNADFRATDKTLSVFMCVCMKTIQNYLDKLEKEGFIKRHTEVMVIGKNDVRKNRIFRICENAPLYVKNTCNKTINKTYKAKASPKEIPIPLPKKVGSGKSEKLLEIFSLKSQELGLKISRFNLEIESQKFDNYYKIHGFDRWTRGNHRMTYRAVENWILTDKYGVFLESRKEKLDVQITKEKEAVNQKERRNWEKRELYADISEYYARITLDALKHGGLMKDDDAITKIQEKFPQHPYMGEFIKELNQ